MVVDSHRWRALVGVTRRWWGLSWLVREGGVVVEDEEMVDEEALRT
jgi:hypothetical protein